MELEHLQGFTIFFLAKNPLQDNYIQPQGPFPETSAAMVRQELFFSIWMEMAL